MEFRSIRGGVALFWNSSPSTNLDTIASDIDLNPEVVALGRTP
jgi:hypothetical protein